jgi:hypothetical protein
MRWINSTVTCSVTGSNWKATKSGPRQTCGTTSMFLRGGFPMPSHSISISAQKRPRPPRLDARKTGHEGDSRDGRHSTRPSCGTTTDPECGLSERASRNQLTFNCLEQNLNAYWKTRKPRLTGLGSLGKSDTTVAIRYVTEAYSTAFNHDGSRTLCSEHRRLPCVRLRHPLSCKRIAIPPEQKHPADRRQHRRLGADANPVD